MTPLDGAWFTATPVAEMRRRRYQLAAPVNLGGTTLPPAVEVEVVRKAIAGRLWVRTVDRTGLSFTVRPHELALIPIYIPHAEEAS